MIERRLEGKMCYCLTDFNENKTVVRVRLFRVCFEILTAATCGIIISHISRGPKSQSRVATHCKNNYILIVCIIAMSIKETLTESPITS